MRDGEDFGQPKVDEPRVEEAEAFSEGTSTPDSNATDTYPDNSYLPRMLFHDGYDRDTESLLPQSRKRKRARSLVSIKGLNAKLGQWRKEISSKYRQYNRKFRRGSQGRAIPTEIYYSVFKAPPGVVQFVPPREGVLSLGYPAQAKFNTVVADCIRAMDDGVLPRRISQGSSGSYFVYGPDGRVCGVFKPKDEEPYGPLSPKWTKWLHRNLFPCFFGRSCLIPNNGYICEAAASVLDTLLQTWIVPFTDTVCLSSPSFYYDYFDRRRYNKRGRPLPEKVGSFQLFLHDYTQANEFLRRYPLPEDGRSVSRQQHYPRTNNGMINLDDNPAFQWTPEVVLQFREELEKLVILDYIMRNTDRGLDNWMIRLEWENENVQGGSKIKKVPRIKIGAIDSGLAWPWKHPDEWRSYPFGWLFLPMSIIGKPFTHKTREHFLPLLTSTKWWEEASIALREVFSRDSEFKERMWRKQWAVMKGQAFNVVEALKDPTQGPLELARRSRILILDDEMDVPLRPPTQHMSNAIETPLSAYHDDENDDDNNNNSKLSTFPALIHPEPQSPVLPSSLPSAWSPTSGKKIQKKPSRGSLSLEARYRALEDNRTRSAESPKNSSDSAAVPHGPGVSLWSELINEENDQQTSDSAKIRTVPTSNDTGFSYAECLADEANKTIIVERIQTVKSKPPVFTWC